MKAFQGFSSQEQDHSQQEQQEGKTERNPRRRALSERNDRNPERGAPHQNNHSCARKIHDDGRDENAERHKPDKPAFSSVTNVILPAGQQDNRRDAKKIGGVISIWERPETALINPKRESCLRQIKRDADRGHGNDSRNKKAKLKASGAKLDFLRADDVEPTHSRDQADETTRCHPRLRRKSGGQRDCEIVQRRASPYWQKKP